MIALRPRHLLLAILLLPAACDSKPAQTAAKPPVAQQTAAAQPAAVKTRRAVTGVMTAVEEGAYPDFSVTIQPDSGEAVTLGRGADMMPEEAQALKGKRVTAAYDVFDDLNLMDITQAGKSLAGENAARHQPDWKQVTGKLGGDDSVSGDLPGEITITPAGGTAWKFKYFVTEAELKAKGQEVTAWYEVRTTEELVSIAGVGAAAGGAAMTPAQRKAAAQKYTASVRPRAWKDDELHEIALVRKVTATGGGSYVIGFEFRAGQPLFEFTVNVARLGLSGSPEVLIGENVFLYYDTSNRVTYLKVPLN